MPRTLRGDNARALVTGRDRETGTVLCDPGYLAFCRDWDVHLRLSTCVSLGLTVATRSQSE